MNLTSIRNALIGSLIVLLFASCNLFQTTGHINLSITDAPIDGDNVDGVFITIASIEYHRNGQWELFEDFSGPETYNVMALDNGTNELLGALELPSGEYSQIRFILTAPDEGSGGNNPESYISFTDAENSPLFVPSGAKSGYKVKAKNSFSVPANGEISITIEFDLRKAVVLRGSTGKYILKPVLRMVVEDQAGSIAGAITYSGTNSLAVFAYEEGDYSDGESDIGADGSQFPNTVTSDLVEEDETSGDLEYVLSFLAPGTYDLVVASYDANGDFVAVEKTVQGVSVESESKTTENINL